MKYWCSCSGFTHILLRREKIRIKNVRTELVNVERKDEIVINILGLNREEIDGFSMHETAQLPDIYRDKAQMKHTHMILSCITTGCKAWQDPSHLMYFLCLISLIISYALCPRNETCHAYTHFFFHSFKAVSPPSSVHLWPTSTSSKTIDK